MIADVALRHDSERGAGVRAEGSIMPKWGIHNIALAEAAGSLLATGNDAGRGAAADMFGERGAAMLGAVGPDLFFSAPDHEAVEPLFMLYRNFEKVIDLYDAVVQPVQEVIEAGFDPIEEAVGTLSPGTVALIRKGVERVKETADLYDATLRTGLFAGVTAGVNIVTDAAGISRASTAIFDPFLPSLQRNEPESDWCWFDMLHYRRSGRFGRALVELSREGTRRQRAYAYGYLSHIATDLVGHAFVNQIVGGPYRLHPQRHVVVENFMDARTVLETDGSSVNQTLFDKLAFPEPFVPLADDVCDLLHEAFVRTYGDFSPLPDRVHDDPDHPGLLSKQQIRDSYEIMHRVLRVTKRMAVQRPREPFSGVADVLADALADVFEAPPTPPDFTGSTACGVADILSFGLTASSRDCYEEFFEDVTDFAEYVGELMQWALETLTDIVDLLLATLVSLPITVLLALLYGIQLLMYEVYQSARFQLSLEGFFTPEPSDLASSHGRNLTTTFHCAGSSSEYPKVRDPERSHLVCPSPRVERPRTAADFFPSDDLTSAHGFLSQRPFDLEALVAYADSSSAEATRKLESAGLRIGNAIDLTAWMIQAAADPATDARTRAVAHTDWNLDADRGYGYKTWEGGIPDADDGGDPTVADEAFTADVTGLPTGDHE